MPWEAIKEVKPVERTLTDLLLRHSLVAKQKMGGRSKRVVGSTRQDAPAGVRAREDGSLDRGPLPKAGPLPVITTAPPHPQLPLQHLAQSAFGRVLSEGTS